MPAGGRSPGAVAGGVQDAEPAARAGADVEQPTAFGKPLYNHIDGGGNVLALPGHRRWDERILGIDQVNNLPR